MPLGLQTIGALGISASHCLSCRSHGVRAVLCGGASLVKKDELVLYGCWNRRGHGWKIAGAKRKGNEDGGEWVRRRMLHFASQACATVDKSGAKTKGVRTWWWGWTRVSSTGELYAYLITVPEFLTWQWRLCARLSGQSLRVELPSLCLSLPPL